MYKLPESIVLDRGLQFAVKMTKKLNSMLGIETKLSTSFYLQTDKQIEYMNYVMIQCSRCLSKELTLVLSDTRELDRVPNTK